MIKYGNTLQAMEKLMKKVLFLPSILFVSLLAANNIDDIVIKELNFYGKNHNFFENVSNKDVKHNLIKKYNISDNEQFLLYETTKDDFTCHVCVPNNDWFYFKKENNNWILKSKIINNKDSIGSWGELVVPELIYTNKDFFIFEYKSSYVAQGVLEEHIDLYSFSNGKFNKILEEMIAFNDEGMYEIPKNNWESKIIYNKDQDNYLTLIIEKNGIKDSKNFNEKKIYNFTNLK